MMPNATVGAPAAAAALKPRLAAAEQQQQQQQEEFPCPRCESSNTKFCYYNNYNLCQPRHFCKSCRRYWTRGGTLRDVPVGGGTRKSSSKRPAAPAAPSNPSKRRLSAPRSSKPTVDLKAVDGAPDDRLLDAATGSFSSLLATAATNGGYGTLLETLHLGDLNHPISWPELELQTGNENCGGGGGGGGGSEINPMPPLPQTESLLSLQEPEYSCWSGGWPDLSIYTPGSGFQ